MKDDTRPAPDPLITGAEIARLAGVTRAAVSNWRRRYDDFPAPAGGGPTSPLFNLADVHAWLAKQRKGHDVSDEVRLWQSLRGVFGDDIIQGLAAVARLLTDGAPPPRLGPEIIRQALELAQSTSKADLMAALTERFLDVTRRAGSDQVSSPRIVRAVQHFAGPVSDTATVLDPACGIGTLLLSVGPAVGPARYGQDVDATMADFAQLRAGLSGFTRTAVRAGDSLRDDKWPGLKADLVVCDPPVAWPDWGREDLLLDARWELGTPSRAESELAWLQHAYAHTAPGGKTVLVMPASVAYRKAGRRIRAEVVRRGILTEVVALPAGSATAHSLPIHLWILVRPDGHTAQTVRMVDLTANAPDGPLSPEPGQVVDIPLIDLLDDTVDLTPGSHIGSINRDYLVEYTALRSRLQEQLRALDALLPRLAPGGGPGTLDTASVSVADLARAGLVEYAEGEPVSVSEHLDTDYLQGFLVSPANKRRSTSSSGTFRADTRGSRIPQLGIEAQRRYGAAFRALQEAEACTRRLTQLSEQATVLAREGLTNGALNPPAEGA
ncbi:N-6 DNA methylase [Kitasatospora aureofaciens]|uniref:N-6 DNA methylase n=1 Tax=Kitasatospora aureofaciens TaxID=1894 RepID=UPI001C466DAE|nr:N-6 DNA methylase [Kitasatospora aureofaciens]MBV6695887.1 N-6 DNA methylase [Kitasatospora aureofaciens]